MDYDVIEFGFLLICVKTYVGCHSNPSPKIVEIFENEINP